jgi:tetrathionate reductase subunit B
LAKYALVVDVSKCNGCFCCQIACKDEFVDNEWPPYSASQPETGHFWMKVLELERGTYPKVKLAYIAEPCMQCDEAPCIKAATNSAIYKRQDGIVIIDPQKSLGQKQIVDSCPYNKIFWNESKNIPQKCTFCAHLLDAGWKEPRCVEVCPTRALVFGDLEDSKSEISHLVKSAEPPHPEFNAKPRVYYIALPKRFIAGSLVAKDSDECLEGAVVTLTDLTANKTYQVKTDNYGDFEFEGLDSGRQYRLKIDAKGYSPAEIGPLSPEKDTYLGEIFLEKP